MEFIIYIATFTFSKLSQCEQVSPALHMCGEEVCKPNNLSYFILSHTEKSMANSFFSFWQKLQTTVNYL